MTSFTVQNNFGPNFGCGLNFYCLRSKYEGRSCFDTCPSHQRVEGGEGGYPIFPDRGYPILPNRGYPVQDWIGVPPSGLDGGALPVGLNRGTHPPSGLDRILPRTPLGLDGGTTLAPQMDGTWTGYAAGSTPLAVSRRRTSL